MVQGMWKESKSNLRKLRVVLCCHLRRQFRAAFALRIFTLFCPLYCFTSLLLPLCTAFSKHLSFLIQISDNSEQEFLLRPGNTAVTRQTHAALTKIRFLLLTDALEVFFSPRVSCLIYSNFDSKNVLTFIQKFIYDVLGKVKCLSQNSHIFSTNKGNSHV